MGGMRSCGVERKARRPLTVACGFSAIALKLGMPVAAAALAAWSTWHSAQLLRASRAPAAASPVTDWAAASMAKSAMTMDRQARSSMLGAYAMRVGAVL